MIGHYLVASDGKTVSVECSENVPPPAPVRINAIIDYRYRAPVITWDFPLNKQRDIKRFQIFKRSSIQEPFTLVAEYDFDNSVIRTVPNEFADPKNSFRMERPIKKYRDRDFDLNTDEAIYAVASVDAHGLSSNLSPQLHLKYDKYTNMLVKNPIVISPFLLINILLDLFRVKHLYFCYDLSPNSKLKLVGDIFATGSPVFLPDLSAILNFTFCSCCKSIFII